MRRILLTSALIGALVPLAFVNTNAAAKLYVCATPQEVDLDLAAYELLTWVEIKGVGSHGEAGSSTNVLNYDTWDLQVIQKAKGLTNAGDPSVELARIFNDPGQIILNAAAKTPFNYAFKMVRNDLAVPGGTGTILYNRGLVMGPVRPFGRNEDFDLEVFTFGLNQLEVVVNPTGGGTPPTATVAPAITGTATVGSVLTSTTGTFTGTATIAYERQWYAGGVPIAGAVNPTFLLTSAQVGKIITVRVRASNLAGSAIAFSPATAAVA